MKKIMILCLSIIGLVSCKETKEIINTTNSVLLSGDYKVTSINGENVSDKEVVLSFNTSENHISANAGCNDMGADFTKELNTLIFGNIIATKMFCDGKMDTERALTGALRAVGSFEFENSVLILYSKEDKGVVINAVRN